jgi:hypothetical protein
MLRLKPSNVTPPDDFTFRVVQDGTLIIAKTRESWIDKIKTHYRDNGYPIPENIVEIAENQLCRRLSGEWCVGGTPHSFVNTRFTLDDFIRGATIAITGTIVDPATAEARALICSRCPVNVSVPGCNACSGVANLVASLKGAKKTKYDHLLKACGVCHCSCEAMVWYSVEDLAKGVTPEMMATYQEIDEAGECWKFKALIDS